MVVTHWSGWVRCADSIHHGGDQAGDCDGVGGEVHGEEGNEVGDGESGVGDGESGDDDGESGDGDVVRVLQPSVHQLLGGLGLQAGDVVI